MHPAGWQRGAGLAAALYWITALRRFACYAQQCRPAHARARMLASGGAFPDASLRVHVHVAHKHRAAHCLWISVQDASVLPPDEAGGQARPRFSGAARVGAQDILEQRPGAPGHEFFDLRWGSSPGAQGTGGETQGSLDSRRRSLQMQEPGV